MSTLCNRGDRVRRRQGERGYCSRRHVWLLRPVSPATKRFGRDFRGRVQRAPISGRNPYRIHPAGQTVSLMARGAARGAGEFEGVLDTKVVDPDLNDDDARDAGELVERLDDDGSQTHLIAIAPHGGDIEEHTDEQAERVAELLGAQLASAWRAKGWRFTTAP